MIDVFLKFNRQTVPALICLKRWLDIFNKYNVTIVCDLFDEHTEPYDELKKIIPPGIKVINSDYSLSNPFSHLLKTKRWHNVASSNLICWEKANSKMFWIIDADDTLFLNDIHFIQNKITNCEQFFSTSGLDGISLDFYREIKKDHWSFGMVLVKKNVNLEQLVHISSDEIFKYKGLILNLDSVFDYARRTNLLKLKSFVFDNCYFQHQLEQHALPWGVYHWINNSIWDTVPLKEDIIIF